MLVYIFFWPPVRRIRWLLFYEGGRREESPREWSALGIHPGRLDLPRERPWMNQHRLVHDGGHVQPGDDGHGVLSPVCVVAHRSIVDTSRVSRVIPRGNVLVADTRMQRRSESIVAILAKPRLPFFARASICRQV